MVGKGLAGMQNQPPAQPFQEMQYGNFDRRKFSSNKHNQHPPFAVDLRAIATTSRAGLYGFGAAECTSAIMATFFSGAGCQAGQGVAGR